MKYFAKIDREKFETEDFEYQNEILVVLELYEYLTSTGGIPIDSTLLQGVKVEPKRICLPVKDVVDDFYEFLLLTYQPQIKGLLTSFFVNFNNKIYGLSKKKQKKKALDRFNKFYKDLKGTEKLSVAEPYESEMGILNYADENRLKFAFYRRKAIKKEVAQREFVLEYLYGNAKYFDGELMNENQFINDFIFFEYQLKVCLALNDKFKFEEDLYFSKLAKTKIQYDKYSDLFYEFEVFLKAYSIIEKLTANISTEVDCLYHSLEELELIVPSKIKYKNFLLEEFNIKKANIVLLELDIQPKNAARVKKYMNLFLKFASKNE
ncbi:MAG: hypothetical protein BM564_11325 [Bacteroidetes bacterium MedPE-SWsnd-G2]|nr:MAG: hypothetical protein BM564_11325 [Bacteroidetes bacterium MedPE-SWsnd-G2]